MKGVFNKFMNSFTPLFTPNKFVTASTTSEPTPVPEGIVEIDPHLILMPFPAPEKLEILASYLNSVYSQNYLIFNVSEHPYNPKPFMNQVVDYTFPGHPCLPLEAAFTLCKEIDSWLNSDPRHVAIVHCQSTKARSGMVAAQYLCYSKGKYKHPKEAIVEFCEKVGLEAERLLFPSQKLYLSYAGDIMNGFIVFLKE